ncbi:MAG: hypothetical protein ABI970_01175 [Chloroflexota bacterium]
MNLINSLGTGITIFIAVIFMIITIALVMQGSGEIVAAWLCVLGFTAAMMGMGDNLVT